MYMENGKDTLMEGLINRVVNGCIGMNNGALMKLASAAGGKFIDPGIAMAILKMSPEEADKFVDSYIAKVTEMNFGSMGISKTEADRLKKINNEINRAAMNAIHSHISKNKGKRK